MEEGDWGEGFGLELYLLVCSFSWVGGVAAAASMVVVVVVV